MKEEAVKSIDWGAIRTDYVTSDRLQTFKALAEVHDVGYHALLVRAKREQWQRARRLWEARQRMKEAETELAFARRVGAEVGRYLTHLCRARLSLEALALDAREASSPIWAIFGACHRVAEARQDLEDALADRPRQFTGSPLKEPDVRSWRRPTKWPEFEFLAYRRGEWNPQRLTPEKLAIHVHQKAC